jgi:phosphoribosylformimino-5-aminoimidazole carboxamide ribotide isomerase
MLIIPAIDLKNGKCVRLRQGRPEDEIIYSEDPAAMALQWQRAGARCLHVVDLDGAFTKSPQNVASIRRILASVTIPIQLGGGIRDRQTIEYYLDLGVRRVIIGTEAARRPEWIITIAAEHPERIVVGLDARDGLAAIDGWTQTTDIPALDLARRFDGSAVAALVFTDIKRDGMQTGPNIDQTRRLAETVSIPVIASGGVSTLQDIADLLALESVGVTGIITGKALYSGSLKLTDALALCRQKNSKSC